jgi:lysophospholipase L1-like esterase
MDDVDFTDVLSDCYTGACGTSSQDQTMDTAIATFSANLKILLSEINTRGAADGNVPWVVLTTYYDPFNTDALSCDDIDIGLGFGLSHSDVTWLQSKLQAINQVITADSATYPKAKVVDLSTVLAGHQFCSTNPWIYGPSILYDDINSPAPFHPTPAGQQAIANTMLSTISSLNL